MTSEYVRSVERQRDQYRRALEIVNDTAGLAGTALQSSTGNLGPNKA